MHRIFKGVPFICLSFSLFACSSNNGPEITPGSVVATLYSPVRHKEKIAITLHLVFDGNLDEKKTEESYQRVLPAIRTLIAMQSLSWSPPPMSSIMNEYLIVDSIKFCDQLKMDTRSLKDPRFNCVITQMVTEKE